MSNIIQEFINIPRNKNKIKYVGALSGLTGLFLAVPPTTIFEAKKAMASIQLFWLTLLTITLTSLFKSFVKFLWKKEEELEPVYNFPLKGTFSLFTLLILVSVIINLWVYILSLYADILSDFLVGFGFIAFVTLGIILLSILMIKKSKKIPLILFLVFDSISIGTLFSLGGFYIQGLIAKLYFPIQWFFVIFPIISFLIFLLFIGLAIHRKVSLIKAYDFNKIG